MGNQKYIFMGGNPDLRVEREISPYTRFTYKGCSAEIAERIDPNGTRFYTIYIDGAEQDEMAFCLNSPSRRDLKIIDLRSGTELNRLIIFPNGRTVAEGGYINSFGEQRIRVIGNAEADP